MKFLAREHTMVCCFLLEEQSDSTCELKENDFLL